MYSNLKFLIVYSSFVLQNAFHSSVEKCFLIWSGILVFTSTFVRIINLSLIEWCKISFWIQFYRISNYLILPFSSFTNDICAASSKHFIYKLKVKSSFAKEKYSLFPWKKIIVREYQSMNFCLYFEIKLKSGILNKIRVQVSRSFLRSNIWFDLISIMPIHFN